VFVGVFIALVDFGFGNGGMLGIHGILGEVSMDHGSSCCCLKEVIEWWVSREWKGNFGSVVGWRHWGSLLVSL
jgi:hypothetical protein